MTDKDRRLFALLPLALGGLCATRIAPLDALAALLLLAWLPGRILLNWLGLADRYDRSARTILSLGISLAVMPALSNPIWHRTNDGWALLAFIALLPAAAILLTKALFGAAEAEAPPPAAPADSAPFALFRSSRARILAVLLFGLLAFGTIGPYWPAGGASAPTPSAIHDYIKHHAMLFALERGPLPLGNPFYADEAAGPTFYYHYFYLLPATLRAIAPEVSIPLAFGLCAALVGIAIAGLLALLAAELSVSANASGSPASSSSDGPATLALLLATVVGGLDILPVLALQMKSVTLDAWADTLVRIHSLITQTVWTPQNMLGLLILLVGAWTLGRKGWWIGWVVFGPLLGVSLIGSSVWIAAAALPGLALFVLSDFRGGSSPVAPLEPGQSAVLRIFGRRLTAALLTGGLMLAFSYPNLTGYAEMSHRFGKTLTMEWPYQTHAWLGRLVPPGPLANLLDLPWVLLIELGALLVFPLLLSGRIWRSAWNDRGVRLLIFAAIVALAGFVTLRSSYTYNDFGQRVILVVMAAGVILASQIVASDSARASIWNPLGWRWNPTLSPLRRGFAAFLFAPLLILGLPAGLYQTPLAALRRHLPESGRLGFLVPDGVKAVRHESGALQYIRDHAPPNAVVQGHWEDQRVELLQLIERQIGVMALQEDTMVFYPTAADRHAAALRDLEILKDPGASAPAVHAALSEHHITHVLVGAIERNAWPAAGAFDDAAWFTRLYRDDRAAVYELAAPPFAGR